MDGPEQGIRLLEEGSHLQGQMQSLLVLLQVSLQPQPPARVEGERWRAACAPLGSCAELGQREAGGRFGGSCFSACQVPAPGSVLISLCALHSHFVEVLAPG